MEFEEKFRHYSDEDLLAIMSNSQEYQDSAIEAVKNILLSRGLSVEKLEELEAAIVVNEFASNTTGNEDYAEGFEGVMQKISRRTLTFLSEKHDRFSNTELVVRFLSFALGIIYLYIVFTAREFLGDFFKGQPVPFLMVFIILPVGIVLFYLFKKIGWTILVFFFILAAISTIIAGSMDFLYAGGELPVASIIELFMSMVVLRSLSIRDIREKYDVDKTFMQIAFIGAIILSVFYLNPFGF